MTGKKAMTDIEPIRLPLTVPFKDVLAALLDDERPFPARFLHRFSDLPPVDLTALKNAWPKVSSLRKHTLLEDLEDLAETDTLTSFEDLARSLLADPDAEVRTRAIRLLWESEDVRLVPVYLKMLREDENAEVRATAANALGQFVYQGELEIDLTRNEDGDRGSVTSHNQDCQGNSGAKAGIRIIGIFGSEGSQPVDRGSLPGEKSGVDFQCPFRHGTIRR